MLIVCLSVCLSVSVIGIIRKSEDRFRRNFGADVTNEYIKNELNSEKYFDADNRLLHLLIFFG